MVAKYVKGHCRATSASKKPSNLTWYAQALDFDLIWWDADQEPCGMPLTMTATTQACLTSVGGESIGMT